MCTSPLKGFKYGETKNGKHNYIITPYSVDHIEINNNGSINRCYDSFISDAAKFHISDCIEIPCGHCLECRLEYARQWADRCMLEASEYDENCFITLTYDDPHLPLVSAPDPNTGEITSFGTLIKKDLQDFMKRLRSRLSENDIKVRFFASGEYGERTCRPHYHIIIFGWIPKDLQLLKMSNLGYAYYKSPFLEEVWPFGNNLVAEASWDTFNYVARYQVKKLNGSLPKDTYEKTGIQKEFVTMSRRPGIGLNWYISHDVCYSTFLHQYLKGKDGSIRINPNRYFDSYLEKRDPELYEEIKAKRLEFQMQRKKIGLLSSSLPYLEQKKVQADSIKRRTKILKGEM